MSEDFFRAYSKNFTYEVKDLAACEAEPITRCGAIQSQGWLLVCDLGTLKIMAASENWSSLLGKPLDQILGVPLHEVLQLQEGVTIKTEMMKGLSRANLTEVRLVGFPDARKHCATFHISGPQVLIDVEGEECVASLDEYPVHELKSLIHHLEGAGDFEEICTNAAERVRQLTGFDRVMIYRFNKNWEGEVVGESKIDSLEPYLGLRYPASDIPAQARQLYFDSKYRMIIDTQAPAVPVYTVQGVARQEIDLGGSFLRASSPIHLKYLQNMGVRASFSVSIKVNNRLWGLISCHHNKKPMHLSREVRSACELAAQILAGSIGNDISHRRLTTKNKTLEVTQALLRSMSEGRTPLNAFIVHAKALMGLTDSTGVYLRIHGQDIRVGECPDQVLIDRVLKEVRSHDDFGIWKSECLKESLQMEVADPKAAGALAVPFSLAYEDALIWFRPETIQEVRWGGKPVDRENFRQVKTTLEPRSSFAAWAEQVKDRSRPWTDSDEDCAQYLLFNFVQGVFAKAAALAQANQELERVTKAKDEFIGMVSHELRTPLGIITGWVDILKDFPHGDPSVVEAIGVIERNAQLQVNLINDLLDLSRIISGKLRISLQSGLNISNLITEAVEGLQPTALAKGVVLEWRPTETAFIVGDSDRLRQILWNLLTNALKFTPKGGRVLVELVLSQSSYEIRITDTGVGIEASQIAGIFDRFVQAGSEKSRQGGLGLGLSIVKALCELHGGKVEASSPGLGQGSRFVVSLPIFAVTAMDTRREDVKKPLTQTRELEGFRILVVEDQLDSARALKYLLERSGAQCTMTSNGKEGFEALQKDQFDLILSDIGMPEMNGYELIQAWRKLEADRRATDRIPAIALTAYARSKDRAMALELGFQNHIPKPVDRDELLAVIRSLGREEQRSPIH